MKQLTIITLVITIGTLCFSSCKKCTSCVVTKTKDGTIDYVYPEYCGSSTEVTNFENAAKTSSSNGNSSEKIVTCTRK